jgi:iron(III) transport system ATP-binding protein
MSFLDVKNTSIAYGSNTVVHDISIQLEKGEIGCLLGPSGCGKTTLLRAIAGFEPVKQGEISLDGNIVSKTGINLPPEKRQIGMVFQDFALFPHLSVADNIRFGIRHLKRPEQKQRINELLSLIGLEKMRSRFPHELSGGQQQRIALARALAPKPHLLLLDEPFSSMDVELRGELAREVRKILKQEQITAILVSHDQNEAFAMADNIGVMRDGRLQQWDSGYNLYHTPANPFVADFIGHGVFIDGIVVDDNKIKTSLAPLEGKVPDGCKSGCKVKILVRPDDILHDDCSPRTALIVARSFQGANYLYTLELEDGTQLFSLVHSHHNHEIGEKLGITLEIDDLVIFPEKKAD